MEEHLLYCAEFGYGHSRRLSGYARRAPTSSKWVRGYECGIRDSSSFPPARFSRGDRDWAEALARQLRIVWLIRIRKWLWFKDNAKVLEAGTSGSGHLAQALVRLARSTRAPEGFWKGC